MLIEELKMQKDRAIKMIKEQYGFDQEDGIAKSVLRFMEDAVESVSVEDMDEVTIKINPKLKAKISRTTKGLIKVEKVKVEKTSSEV